MEYVSGIKACLRDREKRPYIEPQSNCAESAGPEAVEGGIPRRQARVRYKQLKMRSRRGHVHGKLPAVESGMQQAQRLQEVYH